LFATLVAFSPTKGRCESGGVAIFVGTGDAETAKGEPAGRRGSSEVPHIPQKRKVGALSSLQFGQITMVLQMSFL
jgi:hypothetical protein